MMKNKLLDWVARIILAFYIIILMSVLLGYWGYEFHIEWWWFLTVFSGVWAAWRCGKIGVIIKQ